MPSASAVLALGPDVPASPAIMVDGGLRVWDLGFKVEGLGLGA